MIPDITDIRNIPRRTWECRNEHLNHETESTCKRCEGKKYVFPREEDSVKFKGKAVINGAVGERRF